MKRLEIKFSALAVLAILAIVITFTSCQKNASPELPKINNSQPNHLPMVAGSGSVGLTIEYGTRRGARKNREGDELWGRTGADKLDNGNPCQNRSMCLLTSSALEITTDDENHVIIGDEVISGGLLLAEENYVLSEGASIWNLSKDLDGAYFVEIGPNDILPATKQIHFGDGNYFQDLNYILPSFISTYFDGEEIILHKGYHPITEDANGTIKFYL